MKKRTEEEWRHLHELVVIAVIAGKSASIHRGLSWGTIIFDAIMVADTFVKELKERQDKLNPKISE